MKKLLQRAATAGIDAPQGASQGYDAVLRYRLHNFSPAPDGYILLLIYI